MANSISQQLAALKQQGAYRHRQPVQSPQGVEVRINEKSFISFCSNDYLGLANEPRVCQAATKAISQFGLGSGASQLISGYSSLHVSLEEKLADFFGYQRCLLFSSGYLANLGVISAFSTRQSLILEDKLNHASLIDAARYAGSHLKRYRHRDVSHASQIIDYSKPHSCLLVSDGVFSMEGSIAPLQQLAQLKRKFTGKLIIDDAHGIGVLGDHGKGCLEDCGLDHNDIDILIGTFGKSFGCSGAFVLSDHDHIEFLIQKARTLIYTTAPPAALAAAAILSLDIIQHEPERRLRLQNNIDYFRQAMIPTKLNLLDSRTAIQTIILGENEQALWFSQQLENKGLLVMAIRPPTVPKNSARLRITLSSEHSHHQIDLLINALLEIETSLL